MMIDHADFSQIATTLAGHYDSLFYVEIASGKYTEFVPTHLFEALQIPREGDDFFAMSQQNAHRYVHPDDLDLALRIHDRETILENLAKNGTYSVSCRLLINDKIVHIRHIDLMCEDQKHILFCMENIDEEVREKEEQKRTLRSVERLARLDELTGIKNKNAFAEYTQSIEQRIRSVDKELQFGIVMCDVNDLKQINDTRGHSFGDEVLQRACRMICEVFRNSQVYRVGGDEFVVVLTGPDFLVREELLENLRRESTANGRSRSGPVIASGLAVFEPATDARFSDVLKRADEEMYENKKKLKSWSNAGSLGNANRVEIPVPDERRRRLDGLFGAFVTTADEKYVFLNDLRYDYSRWSVPLVDDFAMESEYMYHAGRIWQERVHPDDRAGYQEVVEAIIDGTGDMKYMRYRAKRRDGFYVTLQPRAFILNDSEGNPEYFGGIMIVQ